jgi:hypothetical protein
MWRCVSLCGGREHIFPCVSEPDELQILPVLTSSYCSSVQKRLTAYGQECTGFRRASCLIFPDQNKAVALLEHSGSVS